MSRARGAAGMIAACAAALAGCTFLITFDDAPAGDAGAEADARDGTLAEASVVDVQDASADVPRDIDLAEVTACVGMPNGLYCGNNQIKSYPGSKDDLVTCDGGRVVYVKGCATGVGCIHMPNPKPDQCDECARKDAGGSYCGRDMFQWATENANVRVQCQAGAEVAVTSCTTCTSKGNASTCP